MLNNQSFHAGVVTVGVHWHLCDDLPTLYQGFSGGSAGKGIQVFSGGPSRLPELHRCSEELGLSPSYVIGTLYSNLGCMSFLCELEWVGHSIFLRLSLWPKHGNNNNASIFPDIEAVQRYMFLQFQGYWQFSYAIITQLKVVLPDTFMSPQEIAENFMSITQKYTQEKRLLLKIF